jgi:hypothetical protein
VIVHPREDESAHNRVKSASEGDVPRVSRSEGHIAKTGVLHPRPSDFENVSVGVDSEDLAGRPYEVGEQQGYVAGPTPDIEHAHARADARVD